MNLHRFHLEKLGVIGSIFTLLCCLGFGPLIAFLTAIGAGFIIHDAILAPLLIFFLSRGGIGLFFSYRRHHSYGILVVYIIAAIILISVMFVRYSQPLVWVGVAGLLAASVWDFLVGLTEEQAERKYGDCSCRAVWFKDVPKARAVNDAKGLIKMVILPKTGKILGVHLLASIAADLIHEATLAVKFGFTQVLQSIT
jgi:hypothetical protein